MASLTLADAAARTGTMAKKKWIQKAVPASRKGLFRKKAEAAGKTTREYAREHEHDSGTLGNEARLAETLMGMPHANKKKRLRDAYRSHRS